jgi:acyl-CoA synthetase (NDP forming)
MIAELKGSKLLAGFRGQPPSDVDSLARLLSRMSVLATANEETIRSIDLNPVRVLPKGRGVVVLDALIVSRSQRHSARTPA